MSSCYSGDNVVGCYIHTDTTTCNIEEPLHRLLGGLKHVLRAKTTLYLPMKWLETFRPHESFLTL